MCHCEMSKLISRLASHANEKRRIDTSFLCPSLLHCDLLDDCTSRQFQAPDPWVSRASWPAGSKSQPWNPKTTTQLNGPKMNGTAFRLAFRHELATRALVKLSRLPPGLRGSIDGGAETVDKTWTRNGRCRCMWISWVALPG